MRRTVLLLAALIACTQGDEAPRLFVTVHQFGPVGYRDVSPGGKRIAYTVWRYAARFWLVTP